MCNCRNCFYFDTLEALLHIFKLDFSRKRNLQLMKMLMINAESNQLDLQRVFKGGYDYCFPLLHTVSKDFITGYRWSLCDWENAHTVDSRYLDLAYLE